MLKNISAITFCAISAFAMHNAEININDTDLELKARFDMGQFNNAVRPETMFISGRFLNADESNEDKNVKLTPFYELNFLSIYPVGSYNSNISLGMGMSINHTKNFTSIPLGIEAIYKLPKTTIVPMRFNASVYFAPKSLAFDKADRFSEYKIDYNAEIIPHGNLVLGYRYIRTNYEVFDLRFNSSAYFGFKIGF